MDFQFKNRKLEALYTHERGAEAYPEAVIQAFFEVMVIIESAPDERSLYAIKGLHFERLKGKRSSEQSIRLNNQWRLIVSLEKDQEGKFLVILDIEDYH